jgi:hypothetical protein
MSAEKNRLNGFSLARLRFTALKRGVNEMISTKQYSFYKCHNARLELAGWFFDDLGFGIKFPGDKHKPGIVEYGLGLPIEFIAGTLSFLPEPQEKYGEVSSELFTNKPPLDLPPVKASP